MDKGYYAILQFSPMPERLEFINVGVVLFVPAREYVGVRFSETSKRVERLFGPIPPQYWDIQKSGFEERLKIELSKAREPSRLEQFALLRANQMRLSKIQSVAIDQPDAALHRLFDDLVGEPVIVHREPQARKKLRQEFEKQGVLPFLRKKPEPIFMPSVEAKLTPQYAYQNASMHFIDAMRTGPDPEDALGEVGKRAIVGEWLHDSSRDNNDPKDLIVIGDFSKSKPSFFDEVRKTLSRSKVKLYRLDSIGPLVEHIKSHATSVVRSS